MNVLEAMLAWNEFFVVLGGAAAVLLGLTFIGASIHLERHAGGLRYSDLAISSGTSLFYALIVCLVLLIPEGRPIAQAVLLLVFAGLGFLSARAAYRAARDRHPSRGKLVFRFGLPWASMFVLAAAAVGLALGWPPAVWIIAGVAFANVLMGTQNAWDLLRAAAEDG